MKWVSWSLLVLLALDDGAAWEKTLAEIAAMKEQGEALQRIAAIEKQLNADGSDDARVRLGELLVRAKVPRVGMMQKGMESTRAIALFEQVLGRQPERIDALYLHARTCLALPPMFGKKEAGVASLRKLVAIADARPDAQPPVGAFLLLARLEPAHAERTLRTGLKAHPGNRRLLDALAGMENVAKPAAADKPEPLAPAEAKELAKDAKERFHRALLDDKLDFAALDRALAAGAQLHPDDHEYPLYRGLLRLWQGEAAGGGAPIALEAAAQFRKALELDPKDTRIYGWLGPVVYVLGTTTGRKEMIEEGERLMETGVRKNPEQNLFGRAFAYRVTGTHPDRIEDALYRTLELCGGKPLDRARFLPGPITSRHVSCSDSKYAPHNLAGTLYWAGEFFRSRGDRVRAKDAYEASRRAAREWAYLGLIDERLAHLAGKKPKLSPNPVSCLLCHRR